jgi:nitrite reductase/ring-hydroxylating ferredoxin subunit
MFFGLCVGCHADREELIPNVSFQVTIDLSDPSYVDNAFIVVKDITGRRAGINGVVVYRLSSDTYYAFDLMCPHDKKVSCLVEISDDVTCECSCCASQFFIGSEYGDVIKGPAVWPLKRYQTAVTGGGSRLSIWN